MAANGHVAHGAGGQHPHGQKYIDSINIDDPEYIRENQRPADIAEDLKEMQKRERVTEVLSADGFRNELEHIVREALSLGTQSAESMAVLQQISELVAPLTGRQQQQQQQRLPNGFSQPAERQTFDLPLVPGTAAAGAAFPTSTATTTPRSRVVPVNDLKQQHTGEEYGSKEERQLRCKLAALFRLIDFLGWSEGIYNNNITVRVHDGENGKFLVNPFGLMYSEITASSLLSVDESGNILSRGSSNFGLNEAGFNLHSIIHAARPDIACVIHCCTKNAAAVSAMKCGLLPISQEALTAGNVSYYEDFAAVGGDNRAAAQALGSNNKVLMLRNNGFLACGTTLEEAFHVAYSLMKACEIQVCAMSAGGAQELVHVADADDRTKTSGGGGANVNITGSKKQWGAGELEFEAWMRVLDTLGYHTSYPYKEPLLKPLTSGGGGHTVVDGVANTGHYRHNRDVEYPPFAASLFSQENATDEQRLQALRELIEKRKEAERTRWINTPNNYSKVEISETGTEKPAKIVKWVRGGTGTDRGVGLLATQNGMARLNIAPNGPTTAGTPIKISSSLQFAPVGTDAREMRLKRDEMQQKRMQGAITSGPETKRVNWDEADQLADAMQKGERVVTVSAVSKGIIEREQVHNVGSYTQQWARNPFLNVTDEELNAYKREIVHDGKQQQPPTTTNEPYGTPYTTGTVTHTNIGYEQMQSGARQQQQQQQQYGGSDVTGRSHHHREYVDENDRYNGMSDAGVEAKSGQESVTVTKKKKKGLFSFGSGREKKDKRG